MVDYTSRYKFSKKEVEPISISTSPEAITDSKFKMGVQTKEPIKPFKLSNVVNPVFTIPLKWNTALKKWEISQDGESLILPEDTDGNLLTHAKVVDQLPTELTSNGNLKVAVEESITQNVNISSTTKKSGKSYAYQIDPNASYIVAYLNPENYNAMTIGFRTYDQPGSLTLLYELGDSNYYVYDVITANANTFTAKFEYVGTGYIKVQATNTGSDAALYSAAWTLFNV